MYNQISQSIAEDAYPVRMAGYYAGIWGFGGRSHNCITDLAFMRALPNFQIFAPSDYNETKTIMRKVADSHVPTYIRLSGVPTPIVYDIEPEFSPIRKHQDGLNLTAKDAVRLGRATESNNYHKMMHQHHYLV